MTACPQHAPQSPVPNPYGAGLPPLNDTTAPSPRHDGEREGAECEVSCGSDPEDPTENLDPPRNRVSLGAAVGSSERHDCHLPRDAERLPALRQREKTPPARIGAGEV